MPVVRISLGRFDPSKYEEIRRLLAESQTILVPVIRTLRGNLAYYVGLDRENSAMSNVSIWETAEEADRAVELAADFVRDNLADRERRREEHTGVMAWDDPA